MSLIPKACFFTGHRFIAVEQKNEIKKRLKEEIIKAIEDDFKVFIAGGAIGFDMIASEVVISLKDEYDISLCLYLPCREHTALWSEGDRLRFDSVFAMADEYYFVSDKPYFDGAMQKRNSAMVEASDMCIAYLKNTHSGTYQTVRLAEEKGIKIINIAD